MHDASNLAHSLAPTCNLAQSLLLHRFERDLRAFERSAVLHFNPENGVLIIFAVRERKHVVIMAVTKATRLTPKEHFISLFFLECARFLCRGSEAALYGRSGLLDG